MTVKYRETICQVATCRPTRTTPTCCGSAMRCDGSCGGRNSGPARSELTPAQHQLLLAIRGHDGDPTISEVAAHLLLRHHSAVELVDRAERAGLVERRADPDSRRVVRLALSAEGEARLAALTAAALDELAQLRLTLRVRHGTST